MQSLESKDQQILKSLEDASAVGIAPRQIALKIGTSESSVEKELDHLIEAKMVSKIGRNLFVLTKNLLIESSSDFKTSEYYLKRFEADRKIKLTRYSGKITFNANGGKRVHRWSPYVQGFSSSFVNNLQKKYELKKGSLVADQFLGSGTVAVCSKMHNIDSIGVDRHPLMTFMAKMKVSWDIDPEELFSAAIALISKSEVSETPKEIPFLTETERHFDPPILKNLLRMRAALSSLPNNKLTKMLWFAFGSILVDSSRLWYAPSLGYTEKKLAPNAPFIFFIRKITDIVDDLHYVQGFRDKWGETTIINGDAREHEFEKNSLDLSVTSPPYANGIDYVLNYKIESAWLNFSESYEDMSLLRDKMVACDNISRKTVNTFAESKHYLVNDDWLDAIVNTMGGNLAKKTISRRPDMHLVVKKYFEDIYPTLVKIHHGLKKGRPHIMVVGDSLLSGVYIPADLLIARMAKEIGFKLESFELARRRRSGQRRDFMLRETILTFVKETSEPNISPSRLLDYSQPQ